MTPDGTTRTTGHTPLLWWIMPLLWGYILGKTLGAAIAPPVLAGLGLAVGIAALLLTRNDRLFVKPVWAFLVVLAGTFLAWAYYLHREPPVTTTDETFLPREAELVIQIERRFQTSERQPRLSGFATVVEAPAHLAELKGAPLSFRLWPDVPRDTVLPGAQLLARGKLERLENTAALKDFEGYLLRSGYAYRLDRGNFRDVVQPASAFRQWCHAANLRIASLLSAGAHDKQTYAMADIATAMLLGKKGALSGDQKQTFIASGTMHLFAVSGLHVGVIAGALALVFRLFRLPEWLGACLGLALVFLYVQVIGATPSAVRAFSMVAFFWGAVLFRRKPVPFSALLGSAVLVLLLEPRQLFSAGFQLSYTVVAAILLYAVPLMDFVEQRTAPFRFIPEGSLRRWQRLAMTAHRWLIGSLAVSLAAFLYSTPLTIEYFEIFAPGAVLLNLALVPLATVTIVSSLLATVTGLVHAGFLTVVFNHAAWMLVAAMWWCVKAGTGVTVFFWQAEFRAGWLAPAATLLLLASLLMVGAWWKRHPLVFLLPLVMLAPVLALGVRFSQSPLP